MTFVFRLMSLDSNMRGWWDSRATRVSLAILLSVIPASLAHAQEAAPPVIVLPGSVNANFGSMGPLEPDNVVSSATFEQGVTMWRRGPLFAVAFVDVTVKTDTQGYGWNNTMPYLGGA
jgi:hypothetical protein